MRLQQYLKEFEKRFITREEAHDFISKWKNKLKNFGVTEFEFSKHFGVDRLNHPRNNPPLAIEELDFMLSGFLQKVGTQFKKDVENVRNHTARRRGLNKKNIPENELEFAIWSKSHKIKFAFVLKQDRHQKGTAIILPLTIIRHKTFKHTQGEAVHIG